MLQNPRVTTFTVSELLRENNIVQHSYLRNRMQRTKINSEYSSWEENMFGAPQGSGPPLFNIFLYHLFLIMENIDIANYADGSTPYTTGNSIEEVIQKLENASETLF